MNEASMGGNWFLGWKPSPPPDWLADLRQGAPTGIRWFHLDDCHITLAFLGRLSAEKVRQIRERLEIAVAQQMTAIIGKPLLLPSSRRFSALAFAVESQALSDAIAEQRNLWAALAGIPPESRDPLPHLTFARPERRASFPQLRAIRNWMNELRPPSDCTVSFEGPMLFTWDDDRAVRQFKVVTTAGRRASS